MDALTTGLTAMAADAASVGAVAITIFVTIMVFRVIKKAAKAGS